MFNRRRSRIDLWRNEVPHYIETCGLQRFQRIQKTMTSAGLEAVFLANRDRLLRFLRSLGADDAEDLLHELWLRIESSPAGPIAAPVPYLYRAANNLVLDRHRSASRAAFREQTWSDATIGDVAKGSEEPGADRIMIGRQEVERVDAALLAVGERAARIFRRHRLDGLEQRAVASEMGISLSTVEADLRKVYAALIELKRRFDEA